MTLSSRIWRRAHEYDKPHTSIVESKNIASWWSAIPDPSKSNVHKQLVVKRGFTPSIQYLSLLTCCYHHHFSSTIFSSNMFSSHIPSSPISEREWEPLKRHACPSPDTQPFLSSYKAPETRVLNLQSNNEPGTQGSVMNDEDNNVDFEMTDYVPSRPSSFCNGLYFDQEKQAAQQAYLRGETSIHCETVAHWSLNEP